MQIHPPRELVVMTCDSVSSCHKYAFYREHNNKSFGRRTLSAILANNNRFLLVSILYLKPIVGVSGRK